MGKFKGGDVIINRADRADYTGADIKIGNLYTVIGCSAGKVRFLDDVGDYRERPATHYELYVAPTAPAAPVVMVDPHQPGAKLDAGKLEFDLVLRSFPNALGYVDKVGKFGAKKYTLDGWISVPNGETRYFNADLRHKIQGLRGQEVDAESEIEHAAHAAWDALAVLELALKRKGKAQL